VISLAKYVSERSKHAAGDIRYILYGVRKHQKTKDCSEDNFPNTNVHEPQSPRWFPSQGEQPNPVAHNIELGQ
jgi:hypothetical protein